MFAVADDDEVYLVRGTELIQVVRNPVGVVDVEKTAFRAAEEA